MVENDRKQSVDVDPDSLAATALAFHQAMSGAARPRHVGIIIIHQRAL